MLSLLVSATLNLERRLTGSRELLVPQQLLTVDLGPGFHESLLGSGKSAADELDGIKSEHSPDVLIRGMKMRPVVRGANFHEHSNHDSEESGNLRHR